YRRTSASGSDNSSTSGSVGLCGTSARSYVPPSAWQTVFLSSLSADGSVAHSAAIAGVPIFFPCPATSPSARCDPCRPTRRPLARPPRGPSSMRASIAALAASKPFPATRDELLHRRRSADPAQRRDRLIANQGVVTSGGAIEPIDAERRAAARQQNRRAER